MPRSALLTIVAAAGAAAVAAALGAPGADVGGVGGGGRTERAVASGEPAAGQFAGSFARRDGGARSTPAAGGVGLGPPAGPARGDAPARDRARWRWPIRPRPPVLRPFRAPPSPYAAGHRGLDLATVDGTVVLAVEGGRVTHSGAVAGRGTVTVTSTDGLSSTYEPIVPTVTVGDTVSVGDELGTVLARDGPAHCGPRVCLHLGARRAGSYLDPFPLLVGGRLALLPLG